MELIENLSNREIPFFGIFRKKREYRNIQIKKIFSEIIKVFQEEILSIEKINDPYIFLEPGRWLVNSSFHLLAEVVDKKNSGVILNAGINLVPHIIYENHPIYNISQYSEKFRKEKIYGNLCMAKDQIDSNYRGKEITVGDLMCIKNIEAYSISESWQFIKPKAKVVLMGEGETEIIRREENFQDRYGRDKLFS